MIFHGAITRHDQRERWLLAASELDGWGYRWSPFADPGQWSELLVFSDSSRVSLEAAITFDPGRANRVAAFGADGANGIWYFDAEWRTDPGYPRLKDGFAVNLAAQPVSAPGLADLDGDGRLEIIFGDDIGWIHAVTADGTNLPDWPVVTGHDLSFSPIAVADLNGDGSPTVLAGTTDGWLLAYDAHGEVLDGWPYQHNQPEPMHVVAGAVGGPYPRAVIFACGGYLGLRDHHGRAYPGSVGRILAGPGFQHDPAVGDIDGDGRAEVVFVFNDRVYAVPPGGGSVVMQVQLEAAATAAPVLADLDHDGDAEVLVGLANGVLHALHENGVELQGAWPAQVSSSPLLGVAAAQLVGGAAPEVAVTAFDGTVSLLDGYGDTMAGWPVALGQETFAQPLLGAVTSDLGDVIANGLFGSGWAWNPNGSRIDGWPRGLLTISALTSAYGDLEADGDVELVFLTASQVVVVNPTHGEGPALSTWPMAGHDAGRSGCLDCPLDLVPVPDGPGAATRVSLAAPHPNPLTHGATFRFVVPQTATVELAIHDVRGRRVATVIKGEAAAGHQMVLWHGRDDVGRPVPSGQYLARLRVVGVGVDETVSRKVMVLR